MNQLKFSKIIFFIFFSIGTVLLILQFCFRNEFVIAIMGLYYVLFSIAINLVIVLVFLGSLIFKNDLSTILKSIGIISLNAPIAYIYFLIVIETV